MLILVVRTRLIDPQSPGIGTFQTPVNAKWLENMALRDIALHERHAACVDARGDVYQWGDGFFGSKSDAKIPRITLRGKVRSVSPQVRKIRIQCSCFTEHHKGTVDGLPCLCAISLREHLRLRGK